MDKLDGYSFENNALFDSYDYLFKLVMVGDSGVGKTQSLSRYVHGVYDDKLKSTIGVEFKTKCIKVNKKQVKVRERECHESLETFNTDTLNQL